MSRPLVCVTIAAPTTAELVRQRDAVAEADLVELRLDAAADPDVAGALAGRRRPVIVTCRPTWEGGEFAGSEEERHRLLAQALTLGSEYVDIEWKAGFADLLAETSGQRIVLSMHDFDAVPADLAKQARAMRATGAEVIKIAATANRLSDCLPLMELGASMSRDGGVVMVAMGERGFASRVLAGRFGSAWTYAGAMEGVGQLIPSVLLNDYQFRSLSDATAVYGVVGSPVSHSVSPAMYNAAFRAGGFDAVYLPLAATEADDFVAFGRAIGLKGASVTIPFKVSLLDRVDEVDAVADRIGAINTIRSVDGRWLGDNTDAAGFLAPLKEHRLSVRGMRATILGAGGAARAVAIALSSSGSEVTIVARNRARAEEIAASVPSRTAEWPPARDSWDMLVNCTPVGMYPLVDGTPLPREALTGRLVYDLVYNPMTTRLLREAAASGCDTIGGLEMLVAQAGEQFRCWTGTPAPIGVMRAAALRRLSEMGVNEDHLV